ncbi:hypothetical protein LINPERHAP2_LOCUS31307 [Linum perenne]
MMMSSWVTELIFFPPLPIVAVMSVVSAASLGNAGLSEVRGVHLKYSKFVGIWAVLAAVELVASYGKEVLILSDCHKCVDGPA